jgi:hypothetical protein
MLADCPALIVLGLTVQVVVEATADGREQVAATLPVNPLTAFTVKALLYVAVCPEFTVCDPCPAATVNEKSGNPTKEKFKTLLPPKAMGSGTLELDTTIPELVGPAEPTIM